MDRQELAARLDELVARMKALDSHEMTIKAVNEWNICNSKRESLCRYYLPTIISALRGEGWVSVEERLPEGDEDRLVAAINGDGEIGIWFASNVKTQWCGNGPMRFTHWLAIPTPPTKD